VDSQIVKIMNPEMLKKRPSMNQRQKDFILADINGQTFDNLLNWLIEKEFLIEQYEAHNLNVAQLETVRKAYAKKQAEKAIQDSLDNNSKALLEEIRRGKKSAWEIKDLLLEGKVTEQSLIDEAGLMPEIVQKIMRLTREAVDFAYMDLSHKNSGMDS